MKKAVAASIWMGLLIIFIAFVWTLDLNIKKTVILVNFIYFVFFFVAFLSIVHWYFQGVWSRFHTVLNHFHALNLLAQNIRNENGLILDELRSLNTSQKDILLLIGSRQPFIEPNDKV